MLLIMIKPETLTLITELNGGVTPEIGDEIAYFVFNHDGPNEIISDSEAEKYKTVKVISPDRFYTNFFVVKLR